MNKISLVLVVFVSMFIFININGQSKTDYFTGQWNVLVTGTPNGDAEMVVSLIRKDGKLDGTIKLGEGAELTKFTSIDESEKSITLYFPAGGYDVRLTLEKKDDNNVGGNLMDQFDAKGERVIKGKSGTEISFCSISAMSAYETT
jgi:hypothetical protein